MLWRPEPPVRRRSTYHHPCMFPPQLWNHGNCVRHLEFKHLHVLSGRYRLNCQEAVARCVELQRTYPEELSDDVNYNQAALSLPRKLAAVTRMEGEKEAIQCQALLFSLKANASPCHTDTGLHIHPHVSASQGRGRCHP
jgi:hypothetical protein